MADVSDGDRSSSRDGIASSAERSKAIIKRGAADAGTYKTTSKQQLADDGIVYDQVSEEYVTRMVEFEKKYLSDAGGIESGSRSFWNEKAYCNKIKEFQGGGTVALAGDKLVGFIFHDTTEDNIVFFRKVLVSDKERRRGIGRKLAEHAIATLKLRSHWPCAIRLLVLHSNKVAIHMYENFGMKHERIVQNYYAPGKHALVMRYIVLADEFENRNPVTPSLSDVMTMGMYSAIGIQVRDLGDDVDQDEPKNKERLLQKAKERERIAKLRKSISNRKFILLPDIPYSSLLLSPHDARTLLDEGIGVLVERSVKYKRSYSDLEYAMEGCSLCPTGRSRYLDAHTHLLQYEWKKNPLWSNPLEKPKSLPL